MASIQFGGALAPVHEPALQRAITLRCFGQLEVAITDQAAFDQATAGNGGMEGFAAWLKAAVLGHAGSAVAERMAAGGALLSVTGNIAPIVEGIELQTNASLAGVGAGVRVGSLTLSIGEDDRDALMAMAAEAARVARLNRLR